MSDHLKATAARYAAAISAAEGLTYGSEQAADRRFRQLFDEIRRGGRTPEKVRQMFDCLPRCSALLRDSLHNAWAEMKGTQ